MVVRCVREEAPSSNSEFQASLPLLLLIAWLTMLLMMIQRQAARRARRNAMADVLIHHPGAPPEQLPREDVDRLESDRPLAVFLVGGENELGPHLLHAFKKTYKDEFHQVLLLSVGVMDYGVVDAGVDKSIGFKGTEEAKRLKRKTRLDLDPYLALAHDLGLKADCRVAIGTGPVDEIASLAREIVGTYPKSVFFVGKLVFEKPRWFHRLLHPAIADAIRKRLEREGVPVTVIPVVLRG